MKNAVRIGCYLTLTVFATACGSGGGHSDDKNDTEDLPESAVPNFADAPHGPTGLLKDNIVGAWLVTEESTQYLPLEHRVSRYIAWVHPDSASDTPTNGYYTFNFQGCSESGQEQWISVPESGDTTSTVSYDSRQLPSPFTLNIVSDIRMEGAISDGRSIWQKITTPTEANGAPIVGTASYSVKGSNAANGTVNINCFKHTAKILEDTDTATTPQLQLKGLKLAFGLGHPSRQSLYGDFDFRFNFDPAGSDLLKAEIYGYGSPENYIGGSYAADRNDVIMTDKEAIVTNFSAAGTFEDSGISIEWKVAD